MQEVSKSVLIKNGKYLIMKRAQSSVSYKLLWDFAGGKHDQGEDPLNAVVRETKEETGFDIVPGEEIKTSEYHDDDHDLLFHYFIPKKYTGELKLSHDHIDAVWVSLEEMKNYDLAPSVKTYFDYKN